MTHETVHLLRSTPGEGHDWFGLVWREFNVGILELASQQAGRKVIATCCFCKEQIRDGWMSEEGRACCKEYVKVNRRLI